MASTLAVVAAAGCDPVSRLPVDLEEGGISLPPPQALPPLPDPIVPEDLDPVAGQPLFCDATSLVVDERPADVVLVLDKSRSMLQPWDHDADPETPTVTRWSSLHTVVTSIVGQFDEQLALGSVLFPAVDVDSGSSDVACRVAEEPNAEVQALGGQAVLDSMPPADSVDIFGATPATAAVRLATGHLQSIADGRPQAIVLVTDGAANCSAGATGSGLGSVYDEELETVVAEAFDAGIPVHVVGVDIVDDLVSNPVVNPFEALSNVAHAGGVPRGGDAPFYDALDEASLRTALEQIAAELGCTVAADADGPAEQMNVSLDGRSLPRVESCHDAADAWIRSEGTATRIELCPQTCVAFHEGAQLDVTYACYPER